MECIVGDASYFNNMDNKIPINVLEGFMLDKFWDGESLLGGVYWENMPQYKQMNYWSHKNSFNDNQHSGETGIPILDLSVIKESASTGYTHHINRLMIISNLMNLS